MFEDAEIQFVHLERPVERLGKEMNVDDVDVLFTHP
jgi:hypothetical protein